MGTGGIDELALWSRASGGDGAAFGDLFDLHRNRVFMHALRLVADVTDAEDATASAFLELWRRRADVRVVEASVLPWLLVTTTNVARNLQRSKLRYRALLSRIPHSSEQALPTDVAMLAAVLDLDPELLRALRDLEPLDQSLLALVALEDYSIATAAVALGLTQPAAKARLFRLRQRVRDAVTTGAQAVSEEPA